MFFISDLFIMSMILEGTEKNIIRLPASSQAEGTKSTSFLTHVRNEVDLVSLVCEDGLPVLM